MHSLIVRVVVSVTLASLIGSGVVPLVRAEERHGSPSPYRSTLTEIAEEVRRRALTDPKPSEPVPISSHAVAAPDVFDGEDIEPPPDAPFTHIAAAREAITAPPTAGVAAAGTVKPEIAAGYQSNTWRQGTRSPGAGLGVAPGALAPSSGLDPALQAQALATRGRPFVYGFVRLAVPRDDALEQRLAGLGVQLLGPHDDHHKARMPVGSLAALAAMREIAWAGVSPPKQKLSAELTALRGPEGQRRGVTPSLPLPIVVNLFEGDETGAFRRELEGLGATVGDYDPELESYRAVATAATIDAIAALDFVLFVELIGLTTTGHDQSTPLIDADIIRPGSTPLGHPRFSAASVLLGVMDTGFDMGGHVDLDKFGCGLNFTTDDPGPFVDENGHGTHVLGTIAGTGTANPIYRGVATGLGTIDRIRVAKVWKKSGTGLDPWMESAMDFMSLPAACGSAPPEVINISGGSAGTGESGTDSLTRKLDQKVWTYGQAYVVCSGNTGPSTYSIWRPGVAKNALTVGNVYDVGYSQVGDLRHTSSRGPTGDGRMKPNVVAPGTVVTSARAGTAGGYKEDSGCSMATPHVSGLAATLMEHYPDLRGRPALLRAHLMATALGHDDATRPSNDYGIGRVSGYLSHWDSPNSAGWQTYKFWGGVTSQGFQYEEITVPLGARRLIVVLTWDEPAASAGASRAVTYDLDLWIDHIADCGFIGPCGEYASGSLVDNVEYVILDDPIPGTYRLKVNPVSAPTFPGLPYGLVARVIRGDPTPAMTATLTAPDNPRVGSTFQVKASVATPSYLVSGAQVEMTSGTPAGVTFLGFDTMRHDGTNPGSFDPAGTYTLGNVVPMLGRSATWWYRADAPGPQTFEVRVWSENGGEVLARKTVQIRPAVANLAQTAVMATPAPVIQAPGSTFSVTDTVQNFGEGASRASTTRYYLSLDAERDADDRRLSGTRSVPALAPGASHSGTASVTIPTTTPLGTYALLACADDRGSVEESDETNNCLVAPGPVTVTRPDLVTIAVSSPPAAVARGGKFSVTDTTINFGGVAAGASKTRYYLSADSAKSADDRPLSTDRKVPALAAGSGDFGSVTVSIPTPTPPSTYFLLACADGREAVAETSETNNCVASGTPVTVTP